MSEADALKVMAVLLTADGSCPTCVRDLLQRFVKEFGFRTQAEKIFVEEFENDSDKDDPDPLGFT